MSGWGRWTVRTLLAFVVLFAAGSEVRAQEDSTTEQQDPHQQPASDTPKQSPQDSSSTSPPDSSQTVGAPRPIDTSIKAAGSSLPWVGSNSLLKWGPFSVASLDYNYIADHLEATPTIPATNIGLNVFSADLAFDWHFKNNRFLFQYTPNLAILNGDVSTNAGLDNTLNFGTAIALSPRLTMTLRDDFAQVRTRQLFPDNYLLSDVGSGASSQTNFLENSGSYLSNYATAAFDYRWTPRFSLTFQPGYRYLRTNSSNSQLDYHAQEQVVEFSVAGTYALSPLKNIGILDTVQYLRLRDPLPNSTTYNSTSFFYSQQISASWFIQGQVGVQVSSLGDGSGETLRLSAGGSVVKQFQRSSVSVAYLRGRGATTSFVTNNSEDRVDLNYRIDITRRLSGTAGLGYYREAGNDPRTTAKYATGDLRFLLAPSVYLSAEYSRRFQSSPNIQLLSGNRNTYVFGVHWRPSPLPQH